MTMIPFHRPVTLGNELRNVEQALRGGKLAHGGPFGVRCATWLQEHTGAERAFVTPSGTDALELAAVVLDIGPGDEVVMPSWTFVATASAFALRGAIPVFVDVRPDTLNLDEEQLEAALGPRTKAVVPVHYAGVAAELDPIVEQARAAGAAVVEDAAHAIGASYRGKSLGTIGELGVLSFDEMKNVTCGEGGALLTRDAELAARAEIAQAKGTSRAAFLRGEVDHYSWVDQGSSWGAGEIPCAVLLAQLEQLERATARRRVIWGRYHALLEGHEACERVRRPHVPEHCDDNSHLYGLRLRDRAARDAFIAALRERGVWAVFHYVPLHDSPAGRRLGRAVGALPVTRDAADTLVRLPVYAGLADEDLERVVAAVDEVLSAA